MRKPFERSENQLRTEPIRAPDIPAAAGASRPEITAVDEARLEVGDQARRSIWWLTIPMACLLLWFPIMMTTDIVKGFFETKRFALELQHDLLSQFGENYIKNVIDAGDSTLLAYTYPDGTFSVSEYLRYIWIDRPDGWKNALFYLGSSLSFTFLSMLLFYFGLFYRRTVPLIFDRQRQAVYTWRRGVAMVAPWETVRVTEGPLGVVWFLHDIDGKERPVLIHLGGNTITPAQLDAKQEHVERIAAFMADGPAVIHDAPFRRKEPFSLRIEQPPSDLEVRIDNLLASMRHVHDQSR